LITFWTARLLAWDLGCRYLKKIPLFAAESSQWLLFWIVFMSRLIPIFSFALISYVQSVTAISAWHFALATFIGMLPINVGLCGVGYTFELNHL
jgi:uncharacterized membrane protein YdjX (TVP38/TMEM64 family)